ncbi:MAG: phosphatase PAP2 family protein, partial [Candidatus Heimdallarchaeota archaeon]|nr:phosphatase PAP2 family protein [Candidatus Heimdallarchaeota archaeon]
HKTMFSLLALSGNSQPWIILSLIFFIFDIFMDRTINIFQLLVLGIAGLTTIVVKYIVKRKRPSDEMLKKYVARGDYYSFPSGHASRMACSAIVMILFFPEVGWLFGIWAIGVNIARISLRLHYVLDVIGGTVVGLIIGIIFFIFSGPILELFVPFAEWFPHIF